MNQQSIGSENAIALGNTGWHNQLSILKEYETNK
jgi:hypothetical protein